MIDLEGDGPEAEASRAELFAGELPDTSGWTSTRGGHQLFTADEARLLPTLARLKSFETKQAGQPGVYHLSTLPGLELRIGGFKDDGSIKQLQSACPPTIGTDGQPRDWTGPKTVAPLPGAAYRYLERLAEEAEREQRERAQAAPPTDPRPRDEARQQCGNRPGNEARAIAYQAEMPPRY